VVINPPENPVKKQTIVPLDDKVFKYDKVFSESATQEEVYEAVSTHVNATVRGYNTTIFAYGSTGSGKSYTMTGEGPFPGIIPRAINEIFSVIELKTVQERDVFFYVRLSYVELYNNNFRNLLEFAVPPTDRKSLDSTTYPSSGRQSQRGDKIEVRESPSAGVFLSGPNLRFAVTSAAEALRLIAKGNKYRAMGSTQCNDTSSRSHAILTLHVESEVLAPSPATSMKNSPATSMKNASTTASTSRTSHLPELRLGKMHLVDLAGSERLSMSGSEGGTLVETQNINLSLTALGDVLSALSQNASASRAMAVDTMNPERYAGNLSGRSRRSSSTTAVNLIPVPYRNSKLTHLLKVKELFLHS
jgi:Kinesin motor domain